MRSSVALLCLLSCLVMGGCPKGRQAQVWSLENPALVGGISTAVLGAPQPREEAGRKALCFDGKDDGIFIATNPIQNWDRFTIEVLFKPDAGGPAEQRFLHIQDEQERRVLVETRVTGDTWSLDTFLRSTDADKLTLLDRTKVQPTDRWYWAALVYDGKTMSHYVDGIRQLEGAVTFPPTGPGGISLGVRQNKVHWFKGCIAEVRFNPAAVAPDGLQRPRS
jgi:hypothetical protein